MQTKNCNICDAYNFVAAKAVWAAGASLDKNCELAFRTVVDKSEKNAILALSCVSLYKVLVNGIWIAAGPARSAHGYYVVDEIDLSSYLTEDENVVTVEVLGFNVNSYDTLDVPSFLTAEILREGEVLAATGTEGFTCYSMDQRIVKIQRYSFQRAFPEAYRLNAAKAALYKDPCFDAAAAGIRTLAVEVCGEKIYQPRHVGYPAFERLAPVCCEQTGNTLFDQEAPAYTEDRSYLNISDILKGYLPEELELRLVKEAKEMVHTPVDKQKKAPAFPVALNNGYAVYAFPFNATGFIHFRVHCEEKSVLYLSFDELFLQERVDFTRMSCTNCFHYEMEPGDYEMVTMAPYVMKYLQVTARGAVTVEALELIEYKHAPVPYEIDIPAELEDKLAPICKAAQESFLANAVDVFTDCPSRERAGWLCDAFFTSRVERVLTGASVMEREFLRNFVIAPKLADLPDGMIPMCYPGDHNDHNFIPCWAMWFVIELREYLKRTGDRSLVDEAKECIYDMLRYFEAKENELGLLENLDGWVFVEWSRASDPDVVQDVNYPCNMVYTRMLRDVAELYEDANAKAKSEKLRTVIRERSLHGDRTDALAGIFYSDNEVRKDGILVNAGNTTEVCQYYAFFCGIANVEEDRELWEILKKDFGFQRKETGAYPEVAPANAFIGNYLRIEMLFTEGYTEEVVKNIIGYFTGMANTTGTLWEMDDPSASCNHGFASHVLYWLAQIYGVRAKR